MIEISLYDTATRAKQLFRPQDPSRITVYVCGPTVYNRAHIGNARPAVVFDVLTRLLRFKYGEKNVVYARNITDVDDKIIEAARAEGVQPRNVAKRYERHYVADMAALGVRRPDIAPRATETIPEMIAMIEKLISLGHAYVQNEHVLFRVGSFEAYGWLSGRTSASRVAGARVQVATYKENAADFVLWKPSSRNLIGWDSPWGYGRPGWHIECSAMIEKHLGETIDVHGGGQDLIFPHHENEQAQSTCAHGGVRLAQYWLHNGFLSMPGGDKMSKSLGNVVTVDSLLQEGWSGEEIRFALLSAQYRQPLEWSDSILHSARQNLSKYQRLARQFKGFPYRRQRDPFLLKELSDDLNTPAALAKLNTLYIEADAALAEAQGSYGNFRVGLGRTQQRVATKMFSRFYTLASVLGLDRLWKHDDQPAAFRWFAEAAIEARASARRRRDFEEADRIRDKLTAEGIVLEDGAQGTSWRRA
jgi:cysteinyl-tRNA synthetase